MRPISGLVTMLSACVSLICTHDLTAKTANVSSSDRMLAADR